MILETVEADPNDPEGLPEGSTVLASGVLNDFETRVGGGNGSRKR